MYERLNFTRTQLTPEFIRGVEEFVDHAMNSNLSETRIRCPCVKCRNMKLLDVPVVKTYLYKLGFKLEYWIWTEHDEERPIITNLGGDSRNSVEWDDGSNQIDLMHQMVTNALAICL